MDQPFSFEVTRKSLPVPKAAQRRMSSLWLTELTTSDGQSVRFYGGYMTDEQAFDRAVNEDALIAPEL